MHIRCPPGTLDNAGGIPRMKCRRTSTGLLAAQLCEPDFFGKTGCFVEAAEVAMKSFPALLGTRRLAVHADL